MSYQEQAGLTWDNLGYTVLDVPTSVEKICIYHVSQTKFWDIPDFLVIQFFFDKQSYLDIKLYFLVLHKASRENLTWLLSRDGCYPWISQRYYDIAWDAVGAQIEPYLRQHACWQRPCGAALRRRSLNSSGMKTAAASSRLSFI